MICELSPTYRDLMAAASRPTAPPPAPHARKHPNINLCMLEALKHAHDTVHGELICAPGTRRALVNRGLANWLNIVGWSAHINKNGKLLIATQYQALKQVLTDALNSPA